MLANLDRVLYGLPPITGHHRRALSRTPAGGVQRDTDPAAQRPQLQLLDLQLGRRLRQLPLAYEAWMYDDGPGQRQPGLHDAATARMLGPPPRRPVVALTATTRSPWASRPATTPPARPATRCCSARATPVSARLQPTPGAQAAGGRRQRRRGLGPRARGTAANPGGNSGSGATPPPPPRRSSSRSASAGRAGRRSAGQACRAATCTFIEAPGLRSASSPAPSAAPPSPAGAAPAAGRHDLHPDSRPASAATVSAGFAGQAPASRTARSPPRPHRALPHARTAHSPHARTARSPHARTAHSSHARASRLSRSPVHATVHAHRGRIELRIAAPAGLRLQCRLSSATAPVLPGTPSTPAGTTRSTRGCPTGSTACVFAPPRA